jgi:hypothetical protein
VKESFRLPKSPKLPKLMIENQKPSPWMTLNKSGDGVNARQQSHTADYADKRGSEEIAKSTKAGAPGAGPYQGGKEK